MKLASLYREINRKYTWHYDQRWKAIKSEDKTGAKKHGLICEGIAISKEIINDWKNGLLDDKEV